MVCQKCQSTDIVTIQGQSYCINCGQLVDANGQPALQVALSTKASAKATAKPVAAARSTSTATQPKILPAVKPAAKTALATKSVTTATPVKSSQPSPAPKPTKSATVAVKTVAKRAAAAKLAAAPVSSTVAAKAIDISVAPIINHSKRGASQALTPATPKPARRPHARPTGRQLSDIAPRHKPTILPAAADTQPPAKPAKTTGHPSTTASTTARPASPTTPAQESGWVIVTGVFGALANARAWRQSLLVGLLSVGAVWASWEVLQLWPRSQDGAYQWSVGLGSDLLQMLVGTLAAILMVYLYRNYARASLGHGLSRSLDHRGVGSWSRVGLAALWPSVGIDMLLLILALPLIGAKLVMLYFIEPASYQPGLQELFITVTGNLLISYAALGLIVARWLARFAICLKTIGPIQALSIGLSIYFRRFPVILGLLLLAVASGGLFLAAAYGAISGLSALAMPLALRLVLILLVLTLLSTVMFVMAAGYWLGVYRHLVRQVYPRSFASLLAGRTLKAQSKLTLGNASLAAVSLLVGGLVLVVTIYPRWW